MDIHTLMAKFAELPNSRVGQGPKRWPYPNPALQKEIDDFLSQYPFLTQDAGYVEFLEYYAGASVYPDEVDIVRDDELVIDLYGFNDGLALHIMKDEGQIISRDGFLCFCNTETWDEKVDREFIIETDFLFDATQTRPRGIYIRSSVAPKSAWFCETFLEWLELLIDKKGKVIQAS